jgi:hypothetical protein
MGIVHYLKNMNRNSTFWAKVGKCVACVGKIASAHLTEISQSGGGAVARRPDNAIHWKVIFSTFVKMLEKLWNYGYRRHKKYKKTFNL